MKKILSLLAVAMLATFAVGCGKAKDCNEITDETKCGKSENWPDNKKCEWDKTLAEGKKCKEIAK